MEMGEFPSTNTPKKKFRALAFSAQQLVGNTRAYIHMVRAWVVNPREQDGARVFFRWS